MAASPGDCGGVFVIGLLTVCVVNGVDEVDDAATKFSPVIPSGMAPCS